MARSQLTLLLTAAFVAAARGIDLVELANDITVSLPGGSCLTDEMGTDGCPQYDAGKDGLAVEIAPGATTYDEVQVKLCYSANSKNDRPWRKTKAAVEKDKQCKMNLVKTSDVVSGTVSREQLAQDVPKGMYFFRVFGKLNGEYVAYGDAPGFVQINKWSALDETNVKVAAIICSILAFVLFGMAWAYDKSKRA
eukprot:CAMPEP_0170137512 /NCGR_PEP_ID=MMETSP0033_2-20121228/4216_1 /TAXON_ID=195969 /ORGANISM="Dolichomastix tenuilepis, Strain CCMP3274" /LENGTH=193 /DNA_ID=CAMNT_0010373389 /DNA_START=62 /DNA_END=643 /DNA_ORIENTATION=+